MDSEIRPPSEEEKAWLHSAELHILQLAGQHYGDVQINRSERDLRLLQRLIEDKIVQAEHEVELQCMGVVLGNVLARHSGLAWSVVTNEFGSLLSLHERNKHFTLYPLTMISKRMGGRELDIPVLYASLVNDFGIEPMPAWITIYCKDEIPAVPPEQMLAQIKDNDYLTLAEQYGVALDLVKPARALLRLEKMDGDAGLQLSYRPEGQRQLSIHYWTSPGRVREEVAETLEMLDGNQTNRAKRIREHLAEVKVVVGIEMGFSQLEDMGIVFAYEVARWFGANAGGLIKGDDDAWSCIQNRAFKHL